MSGSTIGDSARTVTQHPALEKGARVGYAASGVVHVLIAWIAAQLALGGGGGSADQSGAFSALSGNPVGQIVLWVATAGFLLLGLWHLAETVLVSELSDRAKAAGKGVLYLAMAWSAFSFARNQGSSSSEQSQDFTATLLGQPFGRVLVGLVGLAVIAVGGYHVFKGWTQRFLEDLHHNPGRFAEQAGTWGYVAKGIALIVVGGLFGVAAVRGQAEEAQGLDGALKALLELPYGVVLLLLTAAGFVAYAVYAMVRARHGRVGVGN